MSNFAARFFNNLTPPAQCPLCGANSAGQAFCAACLACLPRLPATHCRACALPTPEGELCGRCLRHPPAFDAARAALLYQSPLTELIPAAKFGGRWALLPALAELLLPHLHDLPRPDCLLPLPLHPRRLQERGFNQAQEIAVPLARALNIPLEFERLIRVRDTEHQTRLSGKARLRNMRRAFVATGALHGAHIALVDDVMTSGASLQAAAAALKAAGAARVEAWVLARTP